MDELNQKMCASRDAYNIVVLIFNMSLKIGAPWKKASQFNFSDSVVFGPRDSVAVDAAAVDDDDVCECVIDILELWLHWRDKSSKIITTKNKWHQIDPLQRFQRPLHLQFY